METLLTILSVFAGIIATGGFVIKYGLRPMQEQIKTLDVNQSKSYLTDFLADMESGKLKTENQIKRAYEVYDHYIEDLHQNSYVHSKWDELKEKGVI